MNQIDTKLSRSFYHENRKEYSLFFYIFFVLSAFSSGESSKQILKDKYSNVLLVVHYNHPYYDSIPFIKELYSSIFPDIVFFGEASHPNVNVVYTQTGFRFSRVMADVLDRFPGYEGYIS